MRQNRMPKGDPQEHRKDRDDSRDRVKAFVMEALAAARHEIVAHRAQAGGRAGHARLFRAMALAEGVHWNKAIMLLWGKVWTTDENLNGAGLFLEEAVTACKAMMEAAQGSARGLLGQFLHSSPNHLGGPTPGAAAGND